MLRPAIRSAVRGGLRSAMLPPPWWQLDELRALIASLFGNGEQGLIWLPKPQVLGKQALWQQSDGTVIVNADGDPIGRGEDVSGNDNDLTQPVSADRPLYRTDGSLHWVEGDGVGNHFNLPILPDGGDNLVVIAARSDVSHTGYLFDSNNPRFGAYVSGDVLRFVAPGLELGASHTPGDWFVLTIKTGSFGIIVRINGVQVNSTSAASSGFGQSGAMMFSRYSRVAYFDGRVACFIAVTSDVSAGVMESAENFAAKQAGI